MECAGYIYGTMGTRAKGRLWFATFSTGFFCDIVCRSLSVLLDWEASWSENTCGEGGGVTRAMWASDGRDQPQAVRAQRACVPAFCVFKWPFGAAVGICCEEHREINMRQSKGSRQEAWVLSGWPS